MGSPFVLGVYGKSNTGKTMLIGALIQKLTEKGLNVATIKVTDKPISIDREGKDTWKHAEKGATLVVFSSPIETSLLLKKYQKISSVLPVITTIDNFDVVLIEGASDPNIPKIRLGDIKLRENTIFTFNGDIDKVIQVILEKISERKKFMENQMIIKVNGRKIPLTEFPEEIIKNTIVGLLKSLKGVEEITDVEIRFRMK